MIKIRYESSRLVNKVPSIVVVERRKVHANVNNTRSGAS